MRQDDEGGGSAVVCGQRKCILDMHMSRPLVQAQYPKLRFTCLGCML